MEAPAEEASELRRRIAAMDEAQGEEAAEGEAIDVPAAEHEDAPTAEGAGLPDEPIEAAEVESPPIVPVDLDEGRPPIDIDAADFAERSIGPGVDVESVAARRFRLDLGSRPRWPLSHLQTFILALVIVDAIVVGWRNDFVRLFPQTSAFYALTGLSVNLRGVDFAGVTTTAEQREGVPILVVQGNIVNTARMVVDVPRIKFIARNAARQEIYSWTAAPARAGAIRQSPRRARRNALRSGPSMARILIAEDEDALRALCTRALASEGHEVKSACDGSEALDLLAGEQGSFDLLLTDIRMPIMDGIALALAAARDFPDLTILLMTGYADQRERAHGLDAIIHDVIAKPFTVGVLRATINEALAVRARF